MILYPGQARHFKYHHMGKKRTRKQRLIDETD